MFHQGLLQIGLEVSEDKTTKFPSAKVEQIAVSAVNGAFNSIDHITTDIATNDKHPCIDGTLLVYEKGSKHLSKIDLRGEIFVQVKGTQRKLKSKNHIKFSVSKTDLEKYLNVYRGVVFFVVHVGSNGEATVFYKKYLPIDIHIIITECDKSGKTNVQDKFKLLPNDAFALEMLCDGFLCDQKQQLADSVIGFKSIDEWKTCGEKFDHFVLSKRVKSPLDFATFDIWKEDTYIYGYTASGVCHVIKPEVENMFRVEMITKKVFKSGDHEAQFETHYGEGPEGKYIRFGGFTAGIGSKPFFNYTPTGSINEQLRDARFALSIAQNGNIESNGIVLFRGIKFNELTEDDLLNRINGLEKAQQVIELLGIKTNICLEDYDDSALWRFDRLIRAFIDNETVPIAGIDDELVNLNVDLPQGRIKVIAKKESNGEYTFIDPLNEDYIVVLAPFKENDPSHCQPLPSFFLMNEEDMRLAINMNGDRLANALEKCPINDNNSNTATAKLLSMLKAYDQGANCGEELLNCCKVVATKLYELDPDSDTYTINLAQTLMRAGSIPDDVKDRLLDINLNTDDLKLRAACSTLVGEADVARKAIAGLNEDDRQEYIGWPIYSLLNKE